MQSNCLALLQYYLDKLVVEKSSQHDGDDGDDDEHTKENTEKGKWKIILYVAQGVIRCYSVLLSSFIIFLPLFTLPTLVILKQSVSDLSSKIKIECKINQLFEEINDIKKENTQKILLHIG